MPPYRHPDAYELMKHWKALGSAPACQEDDPQRTEQAAQEEGGPAEHQKQVVERPLLSR